MHFDIYSLSSLLVCIAVASLVSFVFSVKHQIALIDEALNTTGIRRDEFNELKGKVGLLIEQSKECE